LTLAAGSFTDGTRVTGTRPELVRAMCEGNAEALLPILDDALGRLGAARGALASTGTVAATVDSGYRAHEALLETKNGKREKVLLDLRAPDAVTSLLALGERGGAVVELHENTAVLEVS
jgi:prephenate dehydrogenase